MENAAIVHTQSLSLQPRNGHSVPFIQLRQSFPSRVKAISPFVDQLVAEHSAAPRLARKELAAPR